MAKKLPIGIDSFEKIRTNDFYYVDKTLFISELLNRWGEVNLFTRPRRFGKTLTMDMLKSFFEIGSSRALFDGLEITQQQELCEQYMGQFPVIFITLKSAVGLNYREAAAALRRIIGIEALRCSFLLKSDALEESEKELYKALIQMDNGNYTMPDELLVDSLRTLSQLLSTHYGRSAILLIDEYDVPLDKAFQGGYYEEMVSLIRNLLGNALKTNPYLHFAVITGCLRISKESIFTGLNNLKVHTLTDNRYDEFFGFTRPEVKKMLEYYDLTGYESVLEEWYDGYRFGSESVYCPWDVINYCDALLEDRAAPPENYWANTSGNYMIRRFIGKADQQTRNEIESLVAGESIVKSVNQELTYNELDSSIDNLWSVLFSTGYLTQIERLPERMYRLAIPNLEIRELFISQIQEWFKESVKTDTTKLEQFCRAFPAGDAAEIERLLKEYLWRSISIRDTASRTNMKENFYHGLLLGLLQFESNWGIRSNTESGEGYSDILIETPEGIGVVIEIKYAEEGRLEEACGEALCQIEEKMYDAALRQDGMDEIVKYGIAFYKKRCRVAKK